jgi:hypothetical protein
LLSELFADENQDAGNERQDGKQDAGGAEAHAQETDDADEDEINGKQKHADVFCDHEIVLWFEKRGLIAVSLPNGAILTGWDRLSRVYICAGMISLPQLG